MKCSILLALALLSGIASATSIQPAPSILTTEVLCNGIKDGDDKDISYSVIVQRAFPSNELLLSIAIDGGLILAEGKIKKTKSDGKETFANDTDGLFINKAFISDIADTYTLMYNGRIVKNLTLRCKEY
jgi:hypothetical protein